VDISVIVCWFFCCNFMCVCVCVCMVEDFSAEDKANGIKFCVAVHRRPGRESPILGNFAPPEAQNWTNQPTTGKCSLGCISLPTINVTLQMHCLCNIVQPVGVGWHVWI